MVIDHGKLNNFNFKKQIKKNKIVHFVIVETDPRLW